MDSKPQGLIDDTAIKKYYLNEEQWVAQLLEQLATSFFHKAKKFILNLLIEDDSDSLALLPSISNTYS